MSEADNKIAFKRRVEVKEALRSEDNGDQIWDGLRPCMVKETEAVCGRSKWPPRHKETWWWNDEIGKRWRESGVCFYRQRIMNHGKRKRMRRLIGKLISKSRGSYIK